MKRCLDNIRPTLTKDTSKAPKQIDSYTGLRYSNQGVPLVIRNSQRKTNVESQLVVRIRESHLSCSERASWCSPSDLCWRWWWRWRKWGGRSGCRSYCRAGAVLLPVMTPHDDKGSETVSDVGGVRIVSVVREYPAREL